MEAIKVLIVFAAAFLMNEPVMAQVDTALEIKTAGWVASLQLNEKVKTEKVKAAITAHLTAVKDWHNSHSFTLVPEGMNPATGDKLTELDRDIIICSTKPKSIHENLMAVLKTELDSAQVETILDKYTVGKVEFTMKGYKAIVPDLTVKEEAEILKNLKQAREQAIDYKNMKEISAIFEIYKTKCEQYLNNNGRNWRQLYKAYTDRIKAEKAAAKQQQ